VTGIDFELDGTRQLTARRSSVSVRWAVEATPSMGGRDFQMTMVPAEPVPASTKSRPALPLVGVG